MNEKEFITELQYIELCRTKWGLCAATAKEEWNRLATDPATTKRYDSHGFLNIPAPDRFIQRSGRTLAHQKRLATEEEAAHGCSSES